MSKLNIVLIIAIGLMAVNSIVWHYQKNTAFITLQKLYQKHEYLLALNKGYLSQYTEASSLLEISNYASNTLKMTRPKKQYRL